MDGRRIGRTLRALRQRLGLRQVDVADRAGVSQDAISRIERGHVDGLAVRTLRNVFASLDADLVVLVRWRGGDLDRLLDHGHAAMSEATFSRLSDWGWVVEAEVSYSEYGERGSIDLLAWQPESRTLLVLRSRPS